MRAAVMRHGAIMVDHLPDPRPDQGQVLVKTLACGICGSDLHTLGHGRRFAELGRRSGGMFAMDVDRDVVMGHEFCAEIVDYGPCSRQPLAVGTRVCSMPLTLSGASVETLGFSNRFPGGYGELMVLSETLLLEVPNGLPSEYAALTEPMAVGVHAVNKAGLDGDEVAVVIGCGPVGLAVIAALKSSGVGPVIAADFSLLRRGIAEAMGADIVVDPGQSSAYDCWRDVAVPEGVDLGDPLTMLGLGPQPRPCVIFECVGRPGVVAQILESAPRHARVVVVGVCMERDHIEPVFAVNKELNLQFVVAYTPEEFSATLAGIAEGCIEVEPLITGRVGVGGVTAAFEQLTSPDVHAKIMVEPWRD